jgi:hypothetical protein
MLPRVVLVLAALEALQAGGQQKEPVPEYDFKAVCLYNFGTFNEWPAAAFPDPKAPFVVGVIGKDPFGAALDDVFRGMTVQGRPSSIKRSAEIEPLKDAHILFVPASEKARFKEILAAFRGKPTLVVGEAEGFAKKGGTLNLFIDGKKPGFEANPKAAKRSGIGLSSKVLRLAKIVEEEEE